MKKSLFLMNLILLGTILFSQVGIGTNTPDASSILDINSNNKGLLVPRVALLNSTDTTTIPNPSNGLLVYATVTQNDITKDNFYYWNGTSWLSMVSSVPETRSISLVAFYNKTLDQSVPTGIISPVLFDQPVFQADSLITYNNGVFTANQDGIFLINLQIGLTKSADADIILGLCNASNNWVGRATYSQTRGRTFNNYNTVLSMKKGDVFKACVYQSVPGTPNIIQGIQTGTSGNGIITNLKVQYF